MARPKKAPRERLQITLPIRLAKCLRVFAKRKDLDISEVVGRAFAEYRNRDIFARYRAKHGRPHPAESVTGVTPE